MSSNSQRRAVEAHRRRLAERGLQRFEVRGLATDKELIRGVARRLAENNEEAKGLRLDLARHFGASEPARAGSILIALRRSPMVGAELDLIRENTAGRNVGL